MQGYRHGFVHLLYAIILVQFVVIAVLLGGFSMEYLSNDYYRGWVDANYPWLGFLMQGQLGALLMGIGLGGTVLLIMAVRGDRRSETEAGLGAERLLNAKRTTDIAVPDGPITRQGTSLGREEPEDVMIELERQDA